MALGFYAKKPDIEAWRSAFSKTMPDLEIRFWPDWGPFQDIRYAFVWAPPKGLLKRCSGLKAVISLGAGVDSLLPVLNEVPKNVPVIRMADKDLITSMAEFILMNVLMHHRNASDYRLLQEKKEWREFTPHPARDRCVGFLGFGNMAETAARYCAELGFRVSTWVRTPRDIKGVRVFAGVDQLADFLSQTNILVSLLPATPQTKGLLNKKTLKFLPKGAAVINAGRGQVLNEDDLIKALDSGHLAGASLDVFQTEPLPKESPLWSHPKVIITPHVASPTLPLSAAEYVAKVIKELEAGKTPQYLLDRGLGY